MSDLISRKDAIEALDFEIVHMTVFSNDDEKNITNPFAQYNKGLEDGIKAIRALPSAEPERTAKVVSDDVIITVNGYRYHYEEYLCNACKKKVFSRDSYCSHCGAKLDWSWNE